MNYEDSRNSCGICGKNIYEGLWPFCEMIETEGGRRFVHPACFRKYGEKK